MQFVRRPLAAIMMVLGLAAAGCGSSSTHSIPPSAVLVNATSKSPGEIVVTRLGAERIGLQTTPAHAVPAPPPIVETKAVAGVKHVIRIPAPKPASTVTVPYSAVVYDPSGRTYVFTNTRAAHVRRGPDHGRSYLRQLRLPLGRAKARRQGRVGRRGGALRRPDRGARADVTSAR